MNIKNNTMITVAKYTKRTSADGMVGLADHVQLGDTRLVDLASLREEQFYNVRHHKFHFKLVINIVDENRNTIGLGFVELMEIKENA